MNHKKTSDTLTKLAAKLLKGNPLPEISPEEIEASQASLKMDDDGNATVLTPEQSVEADCDYVVCMPEGSPTPFTDNEVSPCEICSQPIIHRPHVPRKGKKICVSCMYDIMLAEEEPKQ